MSDIALPNSGVPELPRAERLLSDELLAKLSGRGSGRAFATLYERHHQAIYRYCRSILRNDHDAQDALQSTMMRAYAALCKRERDLAVRPWLFRIAHNEAISITRKRGTRETIEEDIEHPVELEQTVDTRERLARLVSDMQELPERQRGALLMRELSGLSIEEIALALNISQGAAKQTVFEARSSLHELAEGREMDCDLVREAISRRDGRVLRGRRISAHLRDCEGCRAFRAAIDVRGADLKALAPPLPAITASAMLGHLLAHGGGHASGTAASGATIAGGHVAGSLLAKGVVGVAVIAAATGTVKLTVEHHGGTPSHSGSHRASAHPHGATTRSPTVGSGATPRAGVSREQHNLAGASDSVGAGSQPTTNGTKQGASSTPYGQVAPGSPSKGQATHGGSAHGVTPGKAHHATGKSPAHHAHRQPAKPGSQHAPTHSTHPAQGPGEKSQTTHGQPGTAGGSSHGATTPSESHATQSEISGSENVGHASEAAQGAPQPRG
jgi:RNA polymerase sigma factor (sigma-70 family)